MSFRMINGGPSSPTPPAVQQPQPLPPCPGDFAAITCFFNPCHYRKPVENFLRFAGDVVASGVELHVIELSFDGAWEVPSFLNPLRMQTDQVLWHKETLLNILADSLPERITKVAWVDSDVLWDRPDWPKLADEALQKANVIQLFKECVWTNQDGTTQPPRPSVTYSMDRLLVGRWNFGISHPGFAWAARRELWRHGGLFDLHVTGGGDSLMASAFCGHPSGALGALYGGVIEKAWQVWAEPVHEWCQARTGWIDATVTHMFHGTRDDRRYMERLRYIKKLDLATEVRRGFNGLLQWTRPREESEVRRLVEGYFAERKEDG